MPNSVPAGWYPVPGGGKRFWNGREWTSDILGAPSPQAEFAGLSPTLPAPAAIVPVPSPQPVAYSAPTHPAGWYPGPSGMVQWWDGRGWGPYAPQHARPAKEVGIAYVFLLLLGGFGAHRFYLGRPGSAIALLLIWWTGWLLAFAVIGIPLIIAGGIWLLVDLFILPSMVRETNARRLAQV